VLFNEALEGDAGKIGRGYYGNYEQNAWQHGN